MKLPVEEVDITIVVPTLNEVDNVEPLVRRIDTSMTRACIPYDILFVDDHSKDGTVEKIRSLEGEFPVSLQMKKGQRGKAQSVMQGFDSAEAGFVCMIDADLQYPPEAIPRMVDKLVENNADVALTHRNKSGAGTLRNMMTKMFNLVFVRSLFGINYDTQSGLKVFRRSTYDGMELRPSQWSFDLEFIVAALQKRSRILTHEIKFDKRNSGEAKVDVVRSSLELARSSLLLRMRVSRKRIREAYTNNVARYRRVTE